MGVVFLLALTAGCGAEPLTGNARDDGGRPTTGSLDATAGDEPERGEDASAGGETANPPVAAVDAEAGGIVEPSGWWDAQWTKRGKLTVSDPELKEDLTDFQVPVKLEAPAFDYAAAKGAGEDLRFVGEDGQILHHQIDAWNAAGTSLVWLRLPKLGSSPVVVFVYYGNQGAAAPADADVKTVWPEPYAGVWHLSGDGKDSTPHAFDGVEMAGGTFVDAKLGKGLELNGAQKDHITLKHDIKLLAGAPGCTFSAFINPTKIEDSINGMIIMTIGKWFSDNHNSYTDFNVNAAGQMISHVDPGPNTAASGYSRILSDPGFVKANEWAWVTYVIDLPAKEERFFKNGQLVSTKPPPAGKEWAAEFIDMVSSRVVIGSEEDNVSHWYTGSMDELRLEKGMRTAPWIAAQYRALTVPGFVKVEADK